MPPPAMAAIALHGLLEPNSSSSPSSRRRRRLLRSDARHEVDEDDEQRRAAHCISPSPSPPCTLKCEGPGEDAAAAAAAKAKAKAKARGRGFDALGAAERRREADVAGDCDEDVGFFDPRQMRGCSSSYGGGGNSSSSAGFGDRSPPPQRSPLSQSEFYDAREDFFSDGSPSQSSSSVRRDLETELHSLRLNLLKETEQRRLAEEDLLHMQNHWQNMAKSLSRLGLSFRPDCHSVNAQLETDGAALCQEIIVLKAVSEAIERSLTRAESEAAINEIINSKDHEISRLRDRLQYYETVNHEMTQRNQEIKGLARQRRLRSKRKWKLIWSCIGLSFTVGASVLARSYLTDSITNDFLTTSSSAAAAAAASDIPDQAA